MIGLIKMGYFGRSSGRAAARYTQDRFSKSKRMAYLDRLEQQFAQSLVDRVGTRAIICDVPCGDGRFSLILNQANLIASIDYNLDMLLAVRGKHGDAVRGRQLNADISALPLAANSVDLVFSMRLLHHVADAQTRISILQELTRVSRCWVAVSFYRTECWRHIRKRALGKKISGNPIKTKNFCTEAAQCGLELVEKIPRFFGLNAQTLVLLKKK